MISQTRKVTARLLQKQADATRAAVFVRQCEVPAGPYGAGRGTAACGAEVPRFVPSPNGEVSVYWVLLYIYIYMSVAQNETRGGKPQVLVHVSTYQGNPFWNSGFLSHSQMGRFRGV